MEQLLDDINDFAPDDVSPLDLEVRDDRILVHLRSEREMTALQSHELQEELVERGYGRISVDAPHDRCVLIVWTTMLDNFQAGGNIEPKDISEDGYDIEFKDQWTRADKILERLKQMDEDEDKRRELMYHLASAEHRGLKKGREDSPINQ